MRVKAMMDVSKKTKIRHRNELNHTLAQLPLPAKRVMYMALAPIDSKEPLERGRVFKIKAEDLASLAKITPSLAYRQLKEGAKLLGSSRISLRGDDIVALAKELNLPFNSKNMPEEMDLNIIEWIAYSHDEGFLSLKFTRTIEPYISSLIGKRNKFTTQLLTASLRLSSQYSSSLYQLIRKNYSNFKKKNSFVISLEELKDELIAYTFDSNGGTEYKYPEFPIFKRDVLNKAIAEIKKKTEISLISVSVFEKEGRKVSKLQFDFVVDEEEFSGNEDSDQNCLSDEDKLFLQEFDKKVPPKKK
ncbi:replication initiation protein [Yersinia enterocolitica]|uniref:replication initiation protein n=1 Tax=Yersiniaceae TaxID=1903411 RepID=UPI001B07F7E7|nr:replication initiation protein [Yersinia intermedia]EKN3891433.1 replication initiation protein [Yersinia enterocolitica]HBA4338113.1 replication initiation protein [Escherichia coli]HBE9082553.1 replication initiation protein [Serratia fonticola]EKN3944438.1 replication initiation protein [Yersinia enterocolitica]ELI8051340.1 replication initiation protein [Yersinia enterocolitica]